MALIVKIFNNVESKNGVKHSKLLSGKQRLFNGIRASGDYRGQRYDCDICDDSRNPKPPDAFLFSDMVFYISDII